MSSSLDDFLNGKVKIVLNDEKKESSPKSSSLDDFLNGKVKIDMSSQNTFTSEDILTAKGKLLSPVIRNTEKNLPKIVAEKKAEKEEQERWNNLSVGEKIAEPFKNMGANIKYGDLGIKENQAWSEYRSKQDAETLAKAQEATKAREEYEVNNNRIGKGNALTKDFAQYLPQLGGQMKSGLGNAAGGAVAGAGTALAVGQLGPQVGLPEELITVPAGALWGGRAGYVAGTAKYSYDVMAGNAYKNLLDMGVPNEVALELSGDEALINSLIEGTGAVVDLVSLGLGKLASKSSLTAAQKLAQNKLMQAGAAYGMNLISEPLEEMAQEKVSIETEKKAANMSGIERQATDAEDAERIKQSGIGALKVSAISGLGNAGGNIITNKVSDKITQNKINNQIKQEEIQKNIQDYKQNSPYSKYITQNQMKGLENLIPQKNVAPQSDTTQLKEPMQQTNRIEGKTVQNGNMEQIAENREKVSQFSKETDVAGEKPAFSMPKNDNHGRKLSQQEQETLRDSKIRDDKGELVEVYHRTNQDFDEFDKSKFGSATDDGIWGQGFYFSNRDHVDYGKNLKKGYLNITNPFVVDDFKTIEQMADYLDMSERNFHYEPDGLIRVSYNQIRQFTAHVKEKGHDGVIANHGDGLYEYVAFEPEQIVLESNNTSSTPKNYISPTQDIQKATEFISKSTVEDIDALNKMAEEAEKHPDRVDLQFFAEKVRARLEKLSREQIESMVEEGIKQNKISYNESIYRNLRRALGEKGYKYVKEHILDKLDAAKLDNVNMKIEIVNDLKKNVVDKLGIKKGSKESELVQKYGEKEITLDELKEATPNWENVVKADKWFREMYDKLIDEINSSRLEIYPYVEEKIEAVELELKVVNEQIKEIKENGAVNYKKDSEIQLQIDNLRKRIQSKKEFMDSKKKKDTYTYKNAERIKNEAEERLSDLEGLLDIRYENKLSQLESKAEKLQEMLDSEELWRGKRIPKRKDYYRHFQEMTEGFEALGNILATPAEISSSLSGISENTKPNAKWLGLAQRRLGNKTKYDAVGGFLNYLDSASYAINIDPEIKRIRDFTEEIRKASGDNTTANRLIEYLTDYANDLAGKTNPMDRYLQKIIPGGRKTMKAINWLTNRIKSNAVLGNFNSAAAQILNLPQGLADIKNPKNIGIGFWETLTGKDSRYKDSQFITERFESDIYSQFDEKLIDQPKKFATWLLGALDEFGTKIIWNGEYSKAVDMGIKDPVRYADYRTRDLVAGRGIGELSLNQRSKTIGLLAPFTVEVSNYWGVVKDFISAKDFGGLILLQVFGHLFNEGLEELGISAGVFDLIDALIDAWNTEGGIDKKAGRVAGEFLSNTMFGQQLASLYPENGADLGVYKLPTRSELFGDADPTRMGTGSVLSKAITNPITSVVMPWGGTQLNKTTQGLNTFAKGGSYSKDAEGKDKLKYPVKQNAGNLIKSIMFGKWATPEAKDYIDRGFKALSANQTEAYKKAIENGITSEQFYDAYNAQSGIKGIGDLTSPYKKAKIDEVTKGLNKKQKTILYDAFDVSKEAQNGGKKITSKQLKAMDVKFNK